MYKCLNCDSTFDDVEELDFCPYCHKYADDDWAYVECEPCALCGNCPEDEYNNDSGTLPNGGVCESCFEDGVLHSFDEYIADTDQEIDFYIGREPWRGYSVDMDSVIDLLKAGFKAFRLVRPIQGSDICTQYLYDNDSSHFGEWLAHKAKEARRK